MFALVFAVALAFSPQDARLAFATADGLVRTCTPRDAGTEGAHRAADFLAKALCDVGTEPRLDRFQAKLPSGERTLVNVAAEFPASSTNASWTILLSHYDTKSGCACPGANDGASTSGLLVALAGLLAKERSLRDNVMLIWTDGEECVDAYGENDGLWGGRRAAERIAARRLKVKAVVCLDMLGDRDLSISLPANSTPVLVQAVAEAARRAGFPDLVRQISFCVTDDHEPFLKCGFPAIDLIDFNYGPENAYWHTPLDTMDRISEKSLLKTGKIVVELLNVLPYR